MIIAIVGAECTGKSTLTRELAAGLHNDGLDAVSVDEYLRAWCDGHGRTPRRDEQLAIAAAQTRRIAAAATAHAVVVADTTALMTAVYSDWIFGDQTLYAAALDDQRRCHLTLLTALDLPWCADGLQRDGPGVRSPVDSLLRTALAGAGIAHGVVAGAGAQRLDRALGAVRHRAGSGQNSAA